MIKILVGCPTADYYKYCKEDYLNAVKSLAYKNADFLLIDNSKDNSYFNELKSKIPVIKTERMENLRELVARDRNILREKVLNENYDYFLSLEIDVIPPINLIERLLSHKKEIVSAVYYKEYDVEVNNKNINKKVILPLLWKQVNKDEVIQLTSGEVEDNNLKEVAICGLGCVLIHRSVLEKVKFRVEENNDSCDDTWFCYDARKLNFKIYADTSIKCRHLIKNKTIKF